uniref:Uncharacterized protein n=1 Tax=Meloidogyne enterolobii TaxID=390850 RepID=A0A6V7W335_MELEN|nr:unnamed protein product [Meloidogyne enterolobii]
MDLFKEVFHEIKQIISLWSRIVICSTDIKNGLLHNNRIGDILLHGIEREKFSTRKNKIEYKSI